jgi:hypothetical protein
MPWPSIDDHENCFRVNFAKSSIADMREIGGKEHPAVARRRDARVIVGGCLQGAGFSQSAP